MNPIEFRPTKRFSAAIKSPASTIGFTGPFNLALLDNYGAQLGWMGKNDNEWAIAVTSKKDAVTLEACPQNGIVLYRIQGTTRYLSVSNRAYVGFYKKSSATGFTLDGNFFVSDYNGQKLSIYSMKDQYLFAWDKYGVLKVQFVPAEIPAQPLTSQIEHVVVLMLENRSFDNVLGGLYPDKTQQGLYRGLKGNETNPIDPNDPQKGTVQVFQGAESYSSWIMPYPDPGELFDDMNEQIFGTKSPGPNSVANMQGFAYNYSKQPGAPLEKGGPDSMPNAKDIMQYYTENSVPMSYFLAKQYAVCDGWFASGPVQTLSNRVFAHCGTPGLIPGKNESRINNPDFTTGWSHTPPFAPPVHEKTVFELLDERYPDEINWKVYYHDAPLSAICSYVYDHWSWLTLEGGNVFQFDEHIGNETNFEYDIIHNQLPKYSFIEPRYTDFFGGTVNSAHPGGAGIDFKDPNGSSLPPPISVLDGEQLLLKIYNILTKYPETFKKTLFIVIYDENGGMYDHVPPPPAVSPFTHSVDNFSYNRYGVRIPALLINPAIPPGTIYPERKVADKLAFDHTSLISTVLAQFGIDGSLTPRSSSAPKLENLIPPNPSSYSRPEPPGIPSQTVEAAEKTVPSLDAEAALAVLDQQEHPHALAHALVRLLSLEQMRREKKGL